MLKHQCNQCGWCCLTKRETCYVKKDTMLRLIAEGLAVVGDFTEKKNPRGDWIPKAGDDGNCRFLRLHDGQTPAASCVLAASGDPLFVRDVMVGYGCHQERGPLRAVSVGGAVPEHQRGATGAEPPNSSG